MSILTFQKKPLFTMPAETCKTYCTDRVNFRTGEIVKNVPRYEWRNMRTGKPHAFRCMSWRCPSCRPILVKKLRYRLGQWGESKKLNRFWTLTLDPSKLTNETLSKYGDPETEWVRCAALYMSATWNSFRTMLKRRYPKLEYIVVREFHKNMRILHLHILVNHYIPHAWMSKRWDDYGGGKIVFVKYVDVHRVSAYLAPYMTKMGEIESSEWPQRVRRYCTCRGIHLDYTPKQWENRPLRPDECVHTDPPEDPNSKGGCKKCPYRRNCQLRPPGDMYQLYDCGHPMGTSNIDVKPNGVPHVFKQLKYLCDTYFRARKQGSSMTANLHNRTVSTINRILKLKG